MFPPRFRPRAPCTGSSNCRHLKGDLPYEDHQIYDLLESGHWDLLAKIDYEKILRIDQATRRNIYHSMRSLLDGHRLVSSAERNPDDLATMIHEVARVIRDCLGPAGTSGKTFTTSGHDACEDYTKKAILAYTIHCQLWQSENRKIKSMISGTSERYKLVDYIVECKTQGFMSSVRLSLSRLEGVKLRRDRPSRTDKQLGNGGLSWETVPEETSEAMQSLDAAQITKLTNRVTALEAEATEQEMLLGNSEQEADELNVQIIELRNITTKRDDEIKSLNKTISILRSDAASIMRGISAFHKVDIVDGIQALENALSGYEEISKATIKRSMTTAMLTPMYNPGKKRKLDDTDEESEPTSASVWKACHQMVSIL